MRSSDDLAIVMGTSLTAAEAGTIFHVCAANLYELRTRSEHLTPAGPLDMAHAGEEHSDPAIRDYLSELRRRQRRNDADGRMPIFL
jgi:hypothetical protein